MRKLKSGLCIWALCGLLLCIFLFCGLGEWSNELPLEIRSRAAVLMDGVTGQVIFEENPQKRLGPAGSAKVMTLYLAFDALTGGLVKALDARFDGKDPIGMWSKAKSSGD